MGRRLDKKEKRKREEKARAALAGGEAGRSRLLGVIERLGGVEIRVWRSPQHHWGKREQWSPMWRYP